MKQSIIYSLFVVLIFASFVSAAHSNFSIDSYIPQLFEDKRWVVGGSVSLSGDERNSESGNSLSYYVTEREQYNIRYTGEVSTAYQYTYETIPKFYSFSLSASTRYYSNTGENTTNVQRWAPYFLEDENYSRLENKTLNMRLLPHFEYGSYFKDDVFATVSLASNFDYNSTIKYKEYDDNNTTYYYNDTIMVNVDNRYRDRDNSLRRARFNPSVSVGYGRVYSGRYAAVMLYIVNELRAKGMLIQEPDSSQLFELTDILYQYTNKHSIDSRLHRIEMLDALYRYMVDQSLILEKSAYGLLIFDDIYDYYPRNPRYFGFKAEIGFTLDYEYRNQRESSFDTRDDFSILKSIGSVTYNDTLAYSYNTREGESQNKYEFLEKGILVTLQYNKPVSFRWQIDARISGRYFFDSYQLQKTASWYKSNTIINRQDNTYYTEEPVKYNISTSINSDYIISTRTLMNNQITFLYDRVKPQQEWSSYSREEWQVTFRNSLEYRLTIPTTLKINTYYRHEKDETSFSVSASISHYLY